MKSVVKVVGYSFVAVFFLVLTAAGYSRSLPRTRDGYYITGSGIRVKGLFFVDVDVYQATHQMRVIPRDTSKFGIVNADVDKRTIIKMLRNVKLKKILKNSRNAYKINGCEENDKVDRLLSVLDDDLKEGDTFMIAYDSATKTVTAYHNRNRASVKGYDFMRYTWLTWFGKIDMPELGDMLIARLNPPPIPIKSR